jgi:tRNA (guanine10-N2)-methyltransferase
LIESFSYLGFNGPIVMRGADETFCVFEEWDSSGTSLKRIWLGRLIARGSRDAIATYDLKKRCYISTTSMDAELALVTANMTLAAPGKLIYDPFVGTGSFIVAAAHFGAYVTGSDIDGRSVRGKDGKRNVKANFKQYGLEGRFLDAWVADITNSPLRTGRCLDGILCDPPYGIREGLKVLGTRDQAKVKEVFYLENGEAAHL